MFRLCASNCAFTDLKCSVCEKWYCEIFCASCCLMCGEFVCNDCYKDEKCCATGERGSTEIHLERFYGEKLRKDVFNNMGMQKRQSKWENVRKKMMLKVVERVVDGELQFDFDFDLYGVNAFADCFCLLLEEENRRTDCLEFIKKLKRDNMLLFSVIMAQIDDCDLLDDLLSQKTIDINFLAGYAIKHKEGEKLFNLLKERKLLDFRAVEGKVRSVRHLSAFKWLESNGMDVTRDEDLFEALVHNHCVDIWEYLITERGLTTEMLLSQRFGYYKLNLDLAKVLFRLKGLEELQKVEVKKFVFTYEMVKWLISIGYHFEKVNLNTLTYISLTLFLRKSC